MRRFGLLLVPPLLALCGGAGRAAAPPAVSSRAAVLVDGQSGRILYEKSAYVRRAPASTTKLLTAYVVARQGGLDRVVEVSRQAAAVPGSSAHLRAGERYTRRELLEGLLLPSGNDAAHALAEAAGGDVEHFAELSNEAARRIGARQTHFVNPHGLTAAHHYTSAYDLALIARQALADPEIRRIVASQELTLTPIGRSGRSLRNTNRLLGTYLGADGAKTGTTNAAGRCLVASARRGGTHLIAVVLRGGDRFGDAERLLDYGFTQVTTGPRIAAGTPFGRLADGRTPRLQRTLAAPRPIGRAVELAVRLRARPPAEGGIAGVALLLEDRQMVAASPLVVGPLPQPFYRRLLSRRAGVDPASLHSL